jgi:plastocyanin
MPPRRRDVLRALAGAALPLAARAQPQPAQVEIRDNRFQPEALAVPAGTTVRWTNHEKRTSHSVLFLGPEGFESERLLPGDSWQRTFDKPGVYPYTCGPHPEMKGRIDVMA